MNKKSNQNVDLIWTNVPVWQNYATGYYELLMNKIGSDIHWHEYSGVTFGRL